MLLHGFADWPRGPLHVAIGVFDGVHLGHQELLRRLHEGARNEAALAVAATFDPLPEEFFARSVGPLALTTLDRRVSLLEQAGADAVVVFHFDEELSRLSAADFVDRVLDAGDVRRVVVGPDFRFGKGRQGDVALLARICEPRSTAVDVVAPVKVDGEVVSSTRIRTLLRAGDARGAAALLGRDPSRDG